MDIFLLKGKDPSDSAHPNKTWIAVAQREMDARKQLPARFEVYEVEVRSGDLGESPGLIGWIGEAGDI